jgi:hypothetical protein
MVALTFQAMGMLLPRADVGRSQDGFDRVPAL